MSSTIYSRRTLLKLVGLSAGAAGLAACAPSTDNSGGSSDSGGGDGKPTDFTFASWSEADALSKSAIQALMSSYGSSQSVKVTGVPIAFPDYLSQLTLKVRGNQFSGAAQLDIAWLSQLVALGKLRDLGSLAGDAGYDEKLLATGKLDNVQYGLPWTSGAIGLLVNKKMLSGVGLTELPATTTEFEQALTELKKKGVVPYAASTKVAQLKDILIWMQTFGSPLIDGDQVTIGDEASVEAVTWYKGLYDKGLIAADVDRADARALFAQQKTAMYDDAIVGKDVVAKQAADKTLINNIAPAKRPVVKAGDTPRAQQWGHIIVVVDGKGADTAGDFAKWATSDKDTVLKYFDAVSLPPTTTDALASEQVTKDTFTTEFGKQITATATANPFWKFPQYAQMETAVAEQVQAVLIGKASAQDALNQAKKAVQDLV
jgi:multiple sugar transport system substrate-binding protein